MFQVMPPQGGICRLIFHSGTIGSFKSCPRKGASSSRGRSVAYHSVSSHAPARGHLIQLPPKYHKLEFQVMPPQGGIVQVVSAVSCIPKFQVMPPQGGIFEPVDHVRYLYVFQVMPPQGGILSKDSMNRKYKVSSHAPARGHPSLVRSFTIFS